MGKSKNNEYRSAQEFVDDMATLLDNAEQYNEVIQSDWWDVGPLLDLSGGVGGSCEVRNNRSYRFFNNGSVTPGVVVFRPGGTWLMSYQDTTIVSFCSIMCKPRLNCFLAPVARLSILSVIYMSTPWPVANTVSKPVPIIGFV